MDRKISVARANSRYEKIWKNTQTMWGEFAQELAETTQTRETLGEYMNMKKSEQDRIKDVGGFVCGYLDNGKRTSYSVKFRSVLTLDIDDCSTDDDIFCTIDLLYGMYEYVVYSTHKHTPEKPRLRLLIPLDRDVTAEEYEAIGRKVAHDIGIECFDDTTYQASRLMYYPSTAKGAKFEYFHNVGKFLKADKILATYTDWKDVSSWYTSSRVGKVTEKSRKKQENPKEKKGIIGAFCRCYDVPQAIEKFLSDVYTPCENGRYTYTHGSTCGGLVVYGEGDFAYSNHATDCVCGMLCNAFDLIRVHKFGVLDEDCPEGTPVSKLPSYAKMCELASGDDDVKRLILAEKSAEVCEDFASVPEGDDMEILVRMTSNTKGEYDNTIDNVKLVLQGDRKYRGRVALDEFAGRVKIDRQTPWSDNDDSYLRWYLEKKYNITKRCAIDDAVMIVATENKYHPVREYFNRCIWDGVPRIDRFFVEFLGCDDTPYTHAVTRTVFLSAVARIFIAGCKVDTMAVLVGEQGLGKSTILRKLMPNEEWFSDSLANLQSKDAYEQLLEKSIIELGELSALKKVDVESTKLFVSKQSDYYRKAYGHHAENVKRQCIFVGTTNTHDFLKDSTGNRRFYPLDCNRANIKKSVFRDLTDDYRDLLWAEAVELFNSGEQWHIEDKEVLKEAKLVQNYHFDESPLQADIENYLNTPLPDDWEEYDLNQRRLYLQGDFNGVSQVRGTVQREEVCVKELWCECFNHELNEPVPRPMQTEISGVLLRLGWKRGGNKDRKRSKLYGRQKYFLLSKLESVPI